MKDKAPVIILIIVALGLGVGLIVVNQHSQAQHNQDLTNITVLSNNMVKARDLQAELQVVNQKLETNLAAARLDFSNKLAASDANLHSVESNLEKVQAEAKEQAAAQAAASAAAIAEREKKITDLQNQNENLDKQAAELRATITNLDGRIAATQKELAQAQGDRALLLKELKQLQARKDTLEAMFNDLTVLRQRVHELKQEVAEARRLEWIRTGAYANIHEKGGERMLRAHDEVQPVAASPSVNVILKQSGQTKITAPAPTDGTK